MKAAGLTVIIAVAIAAALGLRAKPNTAPVATTEADLTWLYLIKASLRPQRVRN